MKLLAKSLFVSSALAIATMFVSYAALADELLRGGPI
jgi:hypothetical protein